MLPQNDNGTSIAMAVIVNIIGFLNIIASSQHPDVEEQPEGITTTNTE